MAEAPRLEAVLLELSGTVARITLNQPDKRNPLSGRMIADLATAFEWARDEAGVRVVVLTGSGDRAFCAGADLASSFSAPTADPEPGDLQRHYSRSGIAGLFETMRRLGKPIIGRINGHALAGGFGLACACDLLVASDSATFGTPEINVGVWPMMISAVLARNLPRKLVLEMMLLGDRWSADQLRSAGLINRVVPAAELDAVTDEIAGRLAAKSPAILRLGRDAFYRSEDLAFAEALDYLHSQLTLVTLTEDSREGVRAFLEKREPEFRGR